MSTAWALAPLALVLALLLGLRWSAAAAGAAGTVAALGALLLGPFDPEVRTAFLVAGAAAEAGFTTLVIAAIVWPALALHGLQEGSGALARLKEGIAAVAATPLRRTLVVAWFFALLLEGAAGFGTAAALAAPLLVALGARPLDAVVLALAGHALGVSFGAVGTPVAAQLALVPLEPRALAGFTAGLHAALAVVPLVFLARWSAPPRQPADVALAGLAFLVPSLALAWLAGPQLPTLGGALVGGLAVAALWSPGRAAGMPPGLARALAPYLLLVGFVLVARLLPEALARAPLAWAAGPFAGQVEPLRHPAPALLLALLVGALVQRQGAAAVGRAAWRAARRLPPVLAALFAMALFARLMVHGGMVDTLAGAAAGTGPLWTWLAPGVGALGTFVTGSATASNILFTEYQAGVAHVLRLDLALMLAAQGVGAGVGSLVAPFNVVAVAALVGLTGKEGAILRRMAPLALAWLAAAGGLVWLLA